MANNTNIQTVRTDLTNFLISMVRIDFWGLDYPYDTQSPSNVLLPACSAIAIPAEEINCQKINFNQVKFTAKIPYRIVYRFPNSLFYHQLPLEAAEGLLAYIQTIAATARPPSLFYLSTTPSDTPIFASQIGDLKNDWLLYVHVTFLAEFYATSLPDTSLLQPPSYYNPSDPPNATEIQARVYRAKQPLNINDSTTFVADADLIIKPK